jgi:hydrogenase maturation factor
MTTRNTTDQDGAGAAAPTGATEPISARHCVTCSDQAVAVEVTRLVGPGVALVRPLAVAGARTTTMTGPVADTQATQADTQTTQTTQADTQAGAGACAGIDRGADAAHAEVEAGGPDGAGITEISVALVDVGPGDRVLVHAGEAIAVLPDPDGAAPDAAACRAD